jgi:integrase
VARPPIGQVIERERRRGRVFALRFRAYGKRHYVTTGARDRREAEAELANALADVRRGIWKPPAQTTRIEAPPAEPSFHEFASEWVARRRHEVDPRTAEHWEWALSCHLLPVFASSLLSEITPATVDRYKLGKLREREDKLVDRPLSNSSINKTLKVFAQVLDDAVEYGHLESNPARGRKRRLKAAKPRRTWLELDEVRALLDAGGKSRALLATMILAGLRVGELCSLRWRAVDLARGRLTVEESKTDAGTGRVIDLSPMLLDELKVWKADARSAEADDLVFPTRNGTMQHRANISSRVLGKAIERANAKPAEADRPKIADGVTNHTLRRTFASLLYEAGASPAYVMSQMGHASSALALEVYARKMERDRDTGSRMDALIQGADWAQMGTNGAMPDESVSIVATEKPVVRGL